MAGAAWLAAMALVLAGSVTASSPAWAEEAAAASAAEKKDAEAKDRELKRQELITRFEAGKEKFRRDELDKAEDTFKKVQAELKNTEININSLFVRRDPAAWLEKIKARRAELKNEKAEAQRKALAATAQAKDEQERKKREAEAEAKRQERDKKRDELIDRFNAGKDQYRKDELDEAEKTFKKVQAELKATGISISSFFVRRDPASWLDRIKDRREELAEGKTEADRRAKADKAKAQVAEARRLSEKGDVKSLAEAQAKLQAVVKEGALTGRAQRRAQRLLKDVSLTLARSRSAVLLGQAENLTARARAVVSNPDAAAAGRGDAGARDALLQAAKDGKEAKAALTTLTGLLDATEGRVLDRDQSERFAAVMAAVDDLIARAESGARKRDAGARMQVAVSDEEIARQRRRVLAKKARQEADAAAAADDWTAAKAKYLEATNLDPENQAAKDGLLRARRKLGEVPRLSVAEEIGVEKIRRQRFILRTKQELNKAHAQMRGREFRKALMGLDGLVDEINTSGLPEGDVQEYRVAAEALRKQCLHHIEREDEAESERAIKAAARRQKEARARFETIRTEKVRLLISQANAYVRQRDYGKALQAAKEAVKLDPANGEARILRDQSQMWDMHTRSERLKQKRDHEIAKLIMAVEESRIPHAEIITYPEDWVELSQRRKKFDVMRLGKKQTPAVQRIRQQLSKPVTIEFPGTSFDNVIDFLQDLTDVNIVTDKKALEVEGVTDATTIKLRLSNVRLESALNLILEQVNLDYVIKDESIFITNKDGVGKDPELRVYDVRDLVVAMGDHGEDEDGNGGNDGGNGGSGGSGNSGGWNGLYQVGGSDWGGGGNGDDDDDDDDSAQLMEDLANLIQSVIDPESWDTVEGQGSIQQYRDEMLIISATPKVHEQIWDLLTQLREFLSLQVVIEARIITVDDSFVEDMGIDWDATFNLRDASILFDGTPRPWPDLGADRWAIRHPNRVLPQPYEFVAGGGGLPGGAELIYEPFGKAAAGGLDLFPFYSSPFSPVPVGISLPAVSGLTGIEGSVLTIGPVGFLDDVQVNFTLAFAQQSKRANLMTAPRVILMSGGSATITVQTEKRYVASLTPIVDEGAIAYEPVIATVPEGITLSISNCAVSHDRRYVRMSVTPTLSTIDILEQTQVFAITIPSPGGTGGATTTMQGTIAIPTTNTTTVSTDITVPDGGTVLLGGLKTSTDRETETGVPVLSKIPIIKRFFTKRTKYKEQKNIIVLIKPTIVIPQEEEEKLGIAVE